MIEKKIFLAAPISGFSDEKEYCKNRECLIKLIEQLNHHYIIYSEILNIGSLSSYDEPGESAIKDFREIDECDVFIIYHPMRMQTSTLIELGFAIAKAKKIIIIGDVNALPFIALGLHKYSSNIKLLETAKLDKNVVAKVELLVGNLLNE
jgi:nucleoside 2-deoxyribosyltransferase